MGRKFRHLGRKFLINCFTSVLVNLEERLDPPSEMGVKEEAGENEGELGEPV